MKSVMGINFPSIKHAHHLNIKMLRAIWRCKRMNTRYKIKRLPFKLQYDESVSVDIDRAYKDVLQFPVDFNQPVHFL